MVAISSSFINPSFIPALLATTAPNRTSGWTNVEIRSRELVSASMLSL
jgi:hypothetical protein